MKNAVNEVGSGEGESLDKVTQDALLNQSVSRVLKLQLSTMAVLLVVGLIYAAIAGEAVTRLLVALVYGSMLSLIGTLLSARSVKRTTLDAGLSAGGSSAGMVPIFSGLLNKLVIVGGGIALGLIALELDPVWVVTSYIVVQLATVWTMVRPERVTQGISGETDVSEHKNSNF